jgi:ABC-type glycerol-3-phosphate transport system substrate-binding protein
VSVRTLLGLAMLLASLLLSACGGGAPGDQLVSASLAESTPNERRESMQLFVLHTNDNWGETEPCG